MSKEELASRFNILVDRMRDALQEVQTLPNYPKNILTFDGSALSNRFLRITDHLTRPFAATRYCDDGVKAVKV